MSAFKPQGRIESINGFTLKENWYESYRTVTPEQSRQALLDSWTSEEGKEYNATHEACPRCRGRGYTRKDQNVGCHVCLGTGGVRL
jgi:DnaJ-class molecular chaperone